MRTALALALFAPLAAPRADAQTIWSVDDDQPANFTDLQTAYDTVAAGDVIRVGAGSYGALTMVDKGVTVVADEPGVVVAGRVTISRTQQPTLVRGLRVAPGAMDSSREILLVDSPAAPVWVEDLRPADDATSQGHLTVFHDTSVAWSPAWTSLVRCSNRSAVTVPTTGPSGGAFLRSGLLVAGWTSVVDCELFGWRGDDGYLDLSGPVAGTDGGAGVYQSLPPTTASLYLFGTRATGGAGGLGFDDGVQCASGGAGGAGLYNFGELQGADAFAQDCTFLGGAGAPAVGVCLAAEDGARWTGPATADGDLTLLPGLYRELRIEPTTTSGEYTFSFDARLPDALCFWSPAAVPNPFYLSQYFGMVVPNTFLPLSVAGTSDAAGRYEFTISAGPAAWSGQTLFVQSAYLTFGRALGQARGWVGGAAPLVLIP